MTALLLAAGCGGGAASISAGPPVGSTPTSAPTGPGTSPSGCPSPQPLADGKAIAIDYVDLVVHGGVTFIYGSATVDGPAAQVEAADVGPVVFTVSCELSEFTRSGRVQPPGLLADSAGFLPAGTEVRSVRGYPERCRLAAMRDGKWTAYLAQHEVNKVSATEPCAVTHAGHGPTPVQPGDAPR